MKKKLKTDFTSKVQRILDSLLKTRPFFYSIVCKMEKVVLPPDASLRTMATDGKRLVYQPRWIEEESEAVGEFSHKHEVLHYTNKHHLRRRDRKSKTDRDPDLWNYACDLAINHLLTGERGWDAERFLLAGHGKFKAYPVGASAEDYYALLMDDVKEQQQQPEPDQGDQSGDGEPDQQDQQEDGQDGSQDSAESGEDGQGGADGENQADTGADAGQDGTQDGDTGAGKGGSGQAADGDSDASGGQSGAGQGQDAEMDADGTASGGEGEGKGEDGDAVQDAFQQAMDAFKQDMAEQFDVSEVQQAVPDEAAGETQESLEQEWEQAVSMAAVVSERYGKDPAWVKELARSALSAPAVDWKTYLQDWCEKYNMSEFNWSRPSRRFGWRQDVLLPDVGDKTIGKLAWVCDTSGSMQADWLGQTFDWWNQMLQDYPDFELVVMQADTRVCDVTVVTPEELPMDVSGWEWHGRGGTDFRAAFREAEEHEVEGLVFLTDGYGTFPEDEPDFPVLWVVTPNGAPDKHFPFGEVVRM